MAHNNRGNALGGLGRHEEALASYDKAIELDSGYATAHYNRGSALHHSKSDRRGAASWNDKAVELDSGDAAAHYNRGNALYRLKRTEEACVAWKEAKRLAELSGDTRALEAASNNLAEFCK